MNLTSNELKTLKMIFCAAVDEMPIAQMDDKQLEQYMAVHFGPYLLDEAMVKRDIELTHNGQRLPEIHLDTKSIERIGALADKAFATKIE